MYYLLTGIKPSLPPMNLYDVFYGDVKIDANNCIYRILNKVNHKSYIGQAKWLMGRMKCNGYLSHKDAYEDKSSTGVLYRALRKYGLSNFELLVLESGLKESELNTREKYWIKELNTYIRLSGNYGYNMTAGGDDCSNLATHEVRMKAISTQLDRYGKLPCNSAESKKRAVETNKKNHGGVLSFHTEEYYEKLRRLKGSVTAHMNTPEVRAKRDEMDKLHHGGVLGMNLPIHKEAKLRGQMIAFIRRNIKKLKSTDKPFTYEGYRSIASELNVKYVHKHITDLCNDPRWTEEMNQLFKDL